MKISRCCINFQILYKLVLFMRGDGLHALKKLQAPVDRYYEKKQV